MPNITEQLKQLKQVKPRKEWVDSERELLLSQITRQTAVKQQSVFVNSWYLAKSLMPGSLLRFVARPVGVLTVITLFIFSSGIFGVNASKNSLPGDFLYSVKLTSEKVQVGFTVAEEKKAQMHMGFAEERVNEIEAVSQKAITPQKKQEKIDVAAAGLSQEMKKTQQTLEQVKQDSTKSKLIVEAVQKVDQKAEELGDRLEQQKQELLQNDVLVGKSMDIAKEATDVTAVKAVEVIVDKREKGDVSVTDNELVETINKKINKEQEKIKQVETQVKEAAQGQAKLIVDQEKDVETLAVDQKNVDQNIIPNQAEQKLTEAKDFLNHGDLGSALEKIKESATLTQEAKVGAETIVSQNKEAAEQAEEVATDPSEILPIEDKNAEGEKETTIENKGTLKVE